MSVVSPRRPAELAADSVQRCVDVLPPGSGVLIVERLAEALERPCLAALPFQIGQGVKHLLSAHILVDGALEGVGEDFEGFIDGLLTDRRACPRASEGATPVLALKARYQLFHCHKCLQIGGFCSLFVPKLAACPLEGNSDVSAGTCGALLGGVVPFFPASSESPSQDAFFGCSWFWLLQK